MRPVKRKTYALRIEYDLWWLIKQRAEAQKDSISDVMRDALWEYFK